MLQYFKEISLYFIIYPAILIFSIAIIFRFTPQKIKNKISKKLQIVRGQSDNELLNIGYGYLLLLSFLLGFILSAFDYEMLAEKFFLAGGLSIGVITMNTLILQVIKWIINKK